MDRAISMTWAQYRRRRCEFEGREIKLGRVSIEIIATLVMRADPVTVPELIESVHPDPDMEPDYAHLSIVGLLVRLRRKMPGAILTNWGRGYSIAPAANEYREAA